MAIFKDGYFTWRGQNISAQCRSIAFELGTEAQDATAMGNNFRVNAAGLNTAAIEIEANWVAGSTTGLDSLFASTAGVSGAFAFKPTTAAISAANPQYSGSAVRTAYSMGGAVGDQHVANISLVAAGDVTRAIST